MFHSVAELHDSLQNIVTISETDAQILDGNTLRQSFIDQLAYTAVFAEDEALKKEARITIRKIAKAYGAISSSIKNIYFAIGEGKIPTTFTTPAINVRFLTYDTAQIIFSLMIKHNMGSVVFEIARSEIDYTDQRPDEYAVSVLAAAVKAGYKGPVYIQGDHFQFSARRFKEDPTGEANKIKSLIQEAIAADFLNIDIDASTLVDLEKPTQDEQQQTNYKVTSELTEYIRSLEPKGTTISVGAEIGHIGGKNSTPEELSAFMDGYNKILPSGMTGISKISVQTGSSHGGIPLPDGTVAKVSIDFSVIEKTGMVARDIYHIGGVVQHGASTLPNELFDHFPNAKTLEIHLATGFQNIVYDTMPQSLKDQMYAWVEANCQSEWDEKLTKEQNIYKTRKKAIGPFKKQAWMLTNEEKKPIKEQLEKQLEFLFEKLNTFNTKAVVEKYV
ncbi:MAG TPA: class II fructose-bisphosphate aldolase [Patescibacteria group bacterium]